MRMIATEGGRAPIQSIACEQAPTSSASYGGLTVRDVGFDEHRELGQRFLPAEVAHLGGDDGGHALLDDVHLGAAQHFLQGDGHLHFPGQVRIVEFVGVAEAFVRHEFEITPAE